MWDKLKCNRKNQVYMQRVRGKLDGIEILESVLHKTFSILPFLIVWPCKSVKKETYRKGMTQFELDSYLLTTERDRTDTLVYPYEQLRDKFVPSYLGKFLGVLTHLGT